MPNSTALTTVTRVKEELGITSTDDDSFIERLIDEASETIAYKARPMYRAEWLETRAGSGRETLTVARYPLASLGTVLLDDSAITDAEIGDAQAGILFRPWGFDYGADPTEWSFTYTAGYFLPGDDIDGSISVVSGDDSYNSAGSIFPALLRAGDVLYADGFSNSANNGFKTVTSATTSKIIVNASLTTETAGSRTLALRNLPGNIERIAHDMVAMVYQSRDRDSTLKSLTIGPASFTWDRTERGMSIMRRVEALSLHL